MTGTTVLRGVILLGLLLGAGSFARPVATDGAEPPVDELVPRAALPQAALATDSLATEIVLANLFAPNRTPPRHRYAPVDSGAVAADEPVADSLTSMGGGGAAIPALYGTVVSGGVDHALLHLNPASPGPRLYAVGDRDGGYRVASIAPRLVVLSGPQGRVVLRLSSKSEERP
ncbi:MAG: hypothetical protein U0132_21480 [Gemmatimonadaceae bacterium]